MVRCFRGIHAYSNGIVHAPILNDFVAARAGRLIGMGLRARCLDVSFSIFDTHHGGAIGTQLGISKAAPSGLEWNERSSTFNVIFRAFRV